MFVVTFSWFVYSQILDDGRILLLHCILKFILIKAKSPSTRKKEKWKESLNPWNDIGSIQHFNNSLAVFNTWTPQAMKWYWHHHYRKWSWKYSTFNNSFTHPSTWKILVLIFSKKGIFINQHKCTTKLITMAQTARFMPCWHSIGVTVKYNMEDGNPLSNPILYWKLVGGLFT